MIVGHERQLHYIDRVLARGHLAHAYLFHGPAAVGKYTIAVQFAKSLLCEVPRRAQMIENVCSDCSSCRSIEARTHPHVVIVSPEHTLVSKKETRQEIPIEDIRELKRKFSFAPAGDQWRIAILDQAERLSRAAADALLKLLEEPGAQTLFILISENRESLPETVVSRAQAIGFSLVPEQALRQLLADRKVPRARHEEFLDCVGGRPGVLMRLLQEDTLFQEERKLRQEMKVAMDYDGVAELLSMSRRAAGDEEYCARIIRHLFLSARERLLREVGQGGSVVRSLAALKRMHDVMVRYETTNVNPHLALDAMLLEWAERHP